MSDAEFRALVAAGPAVVMVEKGHMLLLLDERDRLAADVARLREELEAAHLWHETERKALSKQPPCTEYNWRRMQHGEQMDIIRAALAPTHTDGGDA